MKLMRLLKRWAKTIAEKESTRFREIIVRFQGTVTGA